MNLLSPQIRRTLKHSFQTFVVAVMVCGFAILLTFVEDFCVSSKRPAWLTIGVELFSMILFICDVLVVLAIVARVVLVAFREFVNEVREE